MEDRTLDIDVAELLVGVDMTESKPTSHSQAVIKMEMVQPTLWRISISTTCKRPIEGGATFLPHQTCEPS